MTNMAKFTEEDKLMRRIGQRFNKGVVKYHLIDDDDKILVAPPITKRSFKSIVRVADGGPGLRL